jgi:hypothetical protein
MAWETIKNGKEVATNGNGLEVGLKLKNYKFRLGKIGVVVCTNKMEHPRMEKSDFLCMNFQIVSRLNKGVQTIKPNLTLFLDMFVTLIRCGD